MIEQLKKKIKNYQSSQKWRKRMNDQNKNVQKSENNQK